jgi:SNF2 family DNA or RNA helicase
MPHADVLAGESRIFLQTRWNEQELVKQIPGALRDSTRKLWTVPLSWAACLQLRGIFKEDLTVGDALTNWAISERANRVDPVMLLRERTEPEEPVPGDKLRAFQRAGVNFLRTAGSALLGDDMGLGKTVQLLELLRALDFSQSLPTLVISPKSVKVNWANEARTWIKEAHPYVISGTAAKRTKELKEAENDPLALILVSYDTLRAHSRLAPHGSIRLRRCAECGARADIAVTSTRCEVHPHALNWMKYRTVVLDEAHRIKDPDARQTRAAWAVGQNPSVQVRYALTGTPLANDPSDLWSIFHFLYPEEFPVKSTFVERYCIKAWGKYGGLEVHGIDPERRTEFFQIIDPRYRRMPKGLVLDQLPPIVRSRRYIELTPKQRKAYEDVEKGLVTRLPDGNVLVAPSDLEEQLRLLQFSSATMRQIGINPETGKPKFEMCDPSSKLDALEEILEELGPKPIAVTAMHRQLINLAAHRLDKLGISYSKIVGGQHEFERDAALRSFQDGKTRVLLFTVDAGGEGLTMTATDTLVFLQRSWRMLANLQAEGRIARIGAEHHESLHYIDLIAKGTVEEDQLHRLLVKAERLEEITRDRETLRKAGKDVHPLDEEEQRILNGDLGLI